MPDVEQVHEVKESLHGNVLFPGHPTRRSTPEYEKTHHELCIVKNTPCYICGVRHSDIDKPGEKTATNPLGARFMESHHFWVQDSLASACDWRKVQQYFPQVTSAETLEAFVDSADNMIIVCDLHHVGYGGVHNTSWNYFVIQRFLLDGYQLFDQAGHPADLDNYISLDEHLEEAAQHADGAIHPPIETEKVQG